MWELNHKETRVPKNWCFWTVVLEKTLESPLDCKEIQPVHPKGDQSWVFIGRTDVEAETPILWPPNRRNWPTGKGPDAWKDWRKEEKGTADSWMASLTQCPWVWVSSGSWCWTGKSGVLQSMGSQKVRHEWGTELTDLLKRFLEPPLWSCKDYICKPRTVLFFPPSQNKWVASPIRTDTSIHPCWKMSLLLLQPKGEGLCGGPRGNTQAPTNQSGLRGKEAKATGEIGKTDWGIHPVIQLAWLPA